MAKDKPEKSEDKSKEEPKEDSKKLDHSGGVALAEDAREDFIEKMFLVGLTPEAPMHYVTVPTLPDLKAVNVTKKTSSLDPHPNADGVYLLSRSRNVTGRHEALCPEELEAFLKFVRTHAFRIAGYQNVDANDPNSKKVPRCNGVVPIALPKDAGITRMRRSQNKDLWPMAKYVYICPKRDASHFEGTPPTVAEMDEAGKKIEF